MVASQLGGIRDLSFIAEVDGHLAGFVLARIEYLGIPISEVCMIQSRCRPTGVPAAGYRQLIGKDFKK